MVLWPPAEATVRGGHASNSERGAATEAPGEDSKWNPERGRPEEGLPAGFPGPGGARPPAIASCKVPFT